MQSKDPVQPKIKVWVFFFNFKKIKNIWPVGGQARINIKELGDVCVVRKQSGRKMSPPGFT